MAIEMPPFLPHACSIVLFPIFRPGEVQFKYVYFNHMNLAQKTTVHTDPRKTSSSTINIPQETLRLIADINSDMNGWGLKKKKNFGKNIV